MLSRGSISSDRTMMPMSNPVEQQIESLYGTYGRAIFKNAKSVGYGEIDATRMAQIANDAELTGSRINGLEAQNRFLAEEESYRTIDAICMAQIVIDEETSTGIRISDAEALRRFSAEKNFYRALHAMHALQQGQPNTRLLRGYVYGSSSNQQDAFQDFSGPRSRDNLAYRTHPNS